MLPIATTSAPAECPITLETVAVAMGGTEMPIPSLLPPPLITFPRVTNVMGESDGGYQSWWQQK